MISAVVAAVDALRGNPGAAHPDASFYLLVLGTMSGVGAAAFVAWRLLTPLGSVYHRGALTIVCSFATILLMLICIPVHQLLGRAGLLSLAGLAAVLAALLSYRARRAGQGA
jgi:hypothetical protein